jgi:diguanylate cyclase (GGDEF)-like protein
LSGQRATEHSFAAELGLLARDPVIAAVVAFGLVLCGWYLTGTGSHALQIAMLWPLEVLTDIALCLGALQVARNPDLARPKRRYWYALACTALLFACGDGFQSVITVRDPVPVNVNASTVQSVFFTVGLLVVVISMLWYPNQNGGQERLRFWLDSAAVLIAGGVLAWCSVTLQAANRNSPGPTVVAAVVLLVVSFAASRVAYSGIAPMSRASALPMITAALLQGLPTLLGPWIGSATEGTSHNDLAVRLIPSVLVVLGPRIQHVQANFDRVRTAPRMERQYRVLPYLAIALTFTVLLLILPHDLSARVWGVVVGAVLITAVVVIRQLLMFHDNISLIGRLDLALCDLRDHESRLREQASHDGLTGLLNRTAFVAAVTVALASQPRRGTCWLLLVDLDDFKAVNDTLGHAAGDQLLRTVAQRLTGTVRTGDVTARLGGDEFAVLCRSQGAHDEDGQAMARRILADITRPISPDGHHLMTVRASVGVAEASPGGDLEQLMRNADVAMYAAKDDGKNGFRLFTPNMSARILEAAKVAVRLREAISEQQFHLLYQPIVSLDDERTVGVEALVRWQRPEGGLISPLDFIPVAERTGLIVPLGRWILGEACRQAVAWRSRYPAAESAVMNVNVSGRQLQEPGFAAEVAAVLADTGLPPERLTIEVTESEALQEDRIQQALRDLHDLGVGLALDDFGTAASSLGLLLTCPMTVLKLDRSFVDGVTDASSRQSAVATAVIQISRALDLGAIAEGIETPEQADYLRGLGYSLAQGFYFSRPESGEVLNQVWQQQDVPAGASGGRAPAA